MNPLLIIQAINALIDMAPKGVSLYVQARELLAASDEPEAQAVLAKLEATYAESAAEADAAIAAALAVDPE